jgi:hypothetical protein
MKGRLFSGLLVLTILSYSHLYCYSQNKEPLIRHWVIPERDPDANAGLIDLTDYYTAALDDDWLVSAGVNLKNLPKGIQEFDHVTFDIRGIVQLGGLSLYKESDYSPEELKIKYPERVTGIQVNQKASEIYFLQASAWGEENNTEVGKYIIHYSDGSSIPISLRYMDSLRDWWFKPGDEMPEHASQAWIGQHDLTARNGYQISLFNYKWKNPESDKTIESIDYISTITNVAPFLIAVSLGD